MYVGTCHFCKLGKLLAIVHEVLAANNYSLRYHAGDHPLCTDIPTIYEGDYTNHAAKEAHAV